MNVLKLNRSEFENFSGEIGLYNRLRKRVNHSFKNMWTPNSAKIQKSKIGKNPRLETIEI